MNFVDNFWSLEVCHEVIPVLLIVYPNFNYYQMASMGHLHGGGESSMFRIQGHNFPGTHPLALPRSPLQPNLNFIIHTTIIEFDIFEVFTYMVQRELILTPSL